ncbi:hypothetical protein N7492_003412 [Penicillium capsulatum]|uniref:Mg2+ transporter protein, CorA-like/Zinc transport protein ZntB n=1 Tax=Penicillium capsulatum TaxID=69766 RepID=A0A9W9LXD1_9EURO|nr:hypothetical protein N7492_003412 [Penicillium capsulatum]
MPDICWSDLLQNPNGYFGCETTHHEDSRTGFNTWAYFEAKHLEKTDTKGLRYNWTSLTLFTRFFNSTEQTVILLLNPTEKVPLSVFTPQCTRLDDPFWVYSCALEEITRWEERAVWDIRDYVRDLEKSTLPSGQKAQPDFRILHDIARHAIHVTESLEVTVRNVEHILAQHEFYTGNYSKLNAQLFHHEIARRLAFFQSYFGSIQQRSVSNEKRLQNEIQLAFNTVAQHDARLSVDISQATRADSATMRTIAFVTLTFLPPTFICAIFSMSFFTYDTDSGWAVSNKLWIYWVFAVPTTAATALLWTYWNKIFPGDGAQSMKETPLALSGYQ